MKEKTEALTINRKTKLIELTLEHLKVVHT